MREIIGDAPLPMLRLICLNCKAADDFLLSEPFDRPWMGTLLPPLLSGLANAYSWCWLMTRDSTPHRREGQLLTLSGHLMPGLITSTGRNLRGGNKGSCCRGQKGTPNENRGCWEFSEAQSLELDLGFNARVRHRSECGAARFSFFVASPARKRNQSAFFSSSALFSGGRRKSAAAFS